jgi:hypothetical protein
MVCVSVCGYFHQFKGTQTIFHSPEQSRNNQHLLAVIFFLNSIKLCVAWVLREKIYVYNYQTRDDDDAVCKKVSLIKNL